MSAQITLLTAVRATERGAFEYLPKPFDLNELISVVNRALSAPAHADAARRAAAGGGRAPAADRPLARHAGDLPRAGPADGDRPHGDDHRRIGHRQGAGGARAARLRQAPQGPVRGAQHGGDPARADRERAVRPRDAAPSPAPSSARPASSSRPRAARCSSTRSATCRRRRRPGCCACCRKASTRRVGGRTPIKANVRIVAATHRDLRRLIQQGLFREDLFYRLNVVPIRLPPLRERLDDIPELANHFLRRGDGRRACRPRCCRRRRMARLKQHRWPGNVRELENLVRRLSALYSEEVIGVETIEAELADAISALEPEPAAGRRSPQRRLAGPTPSTAICRRFSPPTATACRRTACTIVSFPRSSGRSCPWRWAQRAGNQLRAARSWGSIAIRCARRSRTSTSPWYARRRSAEAGDLVTAALGVSRLGDAMSAIRRGLERPCRAPCRWPCSPSLAGTATYAWLAGFAPASFSTRGWITGLLVADLVIAVALVGLAGRRG